MKLFLPLFLCALLLAACGRQPRRLTNEPQPIPQATAPAPAQPATQPRSTQMEERATAEDARATMVIKEENIVPEDRDPATIPSEQEIKAQRREEVRNRRARMRDGNQTAVIEKQAAIGEAPLYKQEPATKAEDLPETSPVVIFEKSNCFRGDCQAYSLYMLPGRQMELDVKKGMDGKKGAYEQQLNPFEYRELEATLDTLRGMTLEPLYPVEEEIPADIPYRQLQIPDNLGNPRIIQVYYDAPEILERYMDRLELMVQAQIWRKSQP